MRKKIFAFLVATLFVITAHLAIAQQTVKLHRIGVLSEGTSAPMPLREIEPFRQGLREWGYLEQKNIAIEFRTAEGKLGWLPHLVAELLRLKPDVIVATTGEAARVASRASSTIPIVTVVSGDPVASGIAASLGRP